MAAATLAVVLGVGLAFGAKGLVGEFGDDTQFGALGPRGVAVYETTDDVYVGDRGNQRVQRFDAAGGFISAFGAAGAAEGQFDRPWGVAVDQDDGSLYVVDSRRKRVQKFNSEGVFQLMWGWGVQTGANQAETCTSTCRTGISGSGAGQFLGVNISNEFHAHPAVDPTTHDVYVPDPGNRRIQRFSSGGVFELMWGWGVQTGANQFETCTGACQSGSSGAGAGQFGANSPTHVAVDSAGNVYAVDPGNQRVQKFDSSGNFVEVFAEATLAGPPNLAPHAIAVDPTDDHVYVATRAGGTGEVHVREFDSAGTLVDTHGEGDTISPTNGAGGIAVNSSTGTIYVTGLDSPRKVFILGDLPVGPATATIAPASDVAAESATLNGSVNPNGSPATYHFEYSTNGVSWTSVPVPDADAGDGTEDVEVSQAVTGLQPNTEYRVRLVAKTVGRFSPTISDETRFMTDAVPPVITFTGSRVEGRTATLLGRIRPRNAPTSYRFEYGTDTNYGSQVPVPEGDAGSGGGETRVSEVITGLEPGTTYHFRLVATNAAGVTQGPDRTFTTAEPPGRAYEMVSPLDKNGDGVLPAVRFGHPTVSSPSGDGVFYAANASFAGNPGSPPPSHYRALREPPAWRTQGMSPPKDPVGLTSFQSVALVAADLSRSVVKTNAELTEGIPPEMDDLFKVYLHDVATGTYRLLSTPPQPGGAPYPDGVGLPHDPVAVEADADFSHVLVETEAELTPDAVRVGGRKLYLWSDLDGSPTLELASVLPGGTPASGTAGSGFQDGSTRLIQNAISDDGSVVYFTSPVSAADFGSLYRRANGITELVADGAQFRGATPDGSRVFYRAGGSDWRRDFDAGTTIELPFGGGLRQDAGLIGFSDDGSRAYGVSSQELDGAPAAGPNAHHLYYWEESGAIRYIGDLRGGEGEDQRLFTYAEAANAIWSRKAIAADGSGLAIVSNSPNLTPDDPSDDNGGHHQVYVYDADSDRMVCASCPRVPAATPATFYQGASGLAAEHGQQANQHSLINQPRGNISEDGARVFFDTAESLVAEDTNGQLDVYVYERGRARLVSTGKSTEGSAFAAASPSGDDVFFTTNERLVGWDTDHLRDLYDARIGGGLPEPPVPAAPCAGDACQGTPAGLPSLLAPVSDWFRGLGDAAPGARPSFSLGRLSRAARARLARGRRAMLPVRVNRAGRVSLTARAKMSKRSAIVARSSKTASRPGTVRLPLKLSKAALRRLARGRALRVSLAVRFAGVREPKRQALRLSRPGAGSRGAARRATVTATEKGR